VGSLIALILYLFSSTLNSYEKWLWVAVTATAAGTVIEIKQAKQILPGEYCCHSCKNRLAFPEILYFALLPLSKMAFLNRQI